ncbi:MULTISPECIES: hypothetical protein [Chryseobacterium]|uniref:Molecular chaperone GroES n=1 Tax=Chryseobacterium candidae TaxID=1978493 RepID=A0ABY2RBB5_9FLAO|nr:MULTISPECIES: hypothetical protein [Chryseobacterium]THV62755.1 hypothetical protein EK417_02555 [Chryseobacterium candidae]SIQ46109.1 hypothetical protein SAMN05880573_105229 [Chryseobacterium sp. RU33C]
MKNIAILFSVLCIQLWSAQNVYMTRVEKTNDNSDKFFFRKEAAVADAIYLGEVEVQGFSKDDALVFSLVYKKAKEIGANTFELKPFENVDGTPQAFNAANYKIALYYTPKEKLNAKHGEMYIFASSEKEQKISINRKDYTVAPRSFLKLKVIPGEVYTISTRKLLGSTVKIQPKADDDNVYFQISSLKVKPDHSGVGGLNLKSGDIIGLEKSYAEFLSAIYTESKL